MPKVDAIQSKTFGANIHDLLKDSFFLVNGSIGDFAKEKINDTINFLNHRKVLNDVKILENRTSSDEKKLLNIKRKEEIELKKKIIQNDQLDHRKTIEVIGEPVIQIKLAEMFDEITNERLELFIIRQRMKDLQDTEKKLVNE